MTDNLRHWSALGKTDPKHTKPFQRAGGFRGTATRPIWTEYRLTEHFGPCGLGWGCDAPDFTLVPAGEEMLVYCTLRCWYIDGERRAELYGVGGDKVLVKRQDGRLVADDEAYKKAFTDALGNAFKHVGAGADVHMGLFEDSKYLAEVQREFAEEATAAPPIQTAPPQHRPADTTPAQQQARQVDPKRVQQVKSGQERRDRIKDALEKAATPKLIDEIISVNEADLAYIKDVHAPAYDALMQLAVARKNELLAAA